MKTWAQQLIGSFAKRAAKYAGIPLRDPALVAMFGQQTTISGVDITEDTALNTSAVWACVNLLSSTIASLPLSAYERKDGGHTAIPNHPAHRLAAVEPNQQMTPFTFMETGVGHVLTWGNSYAEIERVDNSPDGTPVALWPLRPNQMDVEPDGRGALQYKYKAMAAGETDKIYAAYQVLHIPGLGFDGRKGYNVVQRARESLGMTQAAERFGSSFFGRGSMPGGVIQHPGELGKKAIKNLRETWELLYRGPDNAHRVAILEEGMEYKPVTFPPRDAQFLQSRQFQVVEICRWFNVPPHMVRDLTQSTYSNIEHQGIDFLTYSLGPWLKRIAQEWNRKLFRSSERGRMFMDFDATDLLKTDIKTRYAAYKDGRNGGWLSLNDILRRENMNPLPDDVGDVRLVPSTMRALGSVDPGQPIDVTALQAISDYMKNLGKVPAALATELINAAIPSANDQLVSLLVKKLSEQGTVS